jgi:hypothetical protein
MGYRFLSVLLTILALSRPSSAFEVEQGECERILSGKARVRIHYASGVKADVEPADTDNVTSQIDIFPDGRRVPQKWIGGGGLLPLESPKGRFAYADKEAIWLQFELGEARQFAFTYTSAGGRTASGTIAVSIEEVKKAAFGGCQATYVTVATTTTWANGLISSSRILRLYVKELGFFVASTVEVVRNGKPESVTFRATRVELLR